MKILHITASYKPAFIYGGPIYSVAALCESLEVSKAENEQGSTHYDHNTSPVQVYTTLANGKEELPYQNAHTKIIDGVAVTFFKRITKDHSHFSPALLSQLWKNAKNFDQIHIHSWWNLVSMGAVIICLCRGIKPIISPRGMLGDYTFSKPKAIFHQFIGSKLLKKCNFHATTSMEADEILKQVFSGDDNVEVVDLMKEREEQIIKSKETRQQEQKPKIFIIHNLVKLPEQLPTKTRVFDGTLNLIFLSRIHHKKGIELLLDSLALVKFPFKLSIVGEGELAYVESLKLKAKRKKLDERIDWIGPVYGEKKYKLLTNHDAFILPSYNENFANVVIEAIAMETPVLLSEHIGLQNYVKVNNYGLVFKLDELKSGLEKTYRLLSEGKLSIDGSKLISNKDLARKYLKMYKVSLNGNSIN